MKKNGFAPLIIILVIAILGIVVYFSLNKTAISPANTSQTPTATSDYKFSWDESNKTAVVSKGSDQILTFKLAGTPKEVDFYVPGNIVATVIKDDNAIEQLYVYKDGKLQKVYSGKKITYGTNLKDLPTSIRGGGFSPDGNYFLIGESGYEWSSTHMFSLQNLKELSLAVDEPVSPIWQPEGACFVDVNPGGYYSTHFNIFKFKGDSFVNSNLAISDKAVQSALFSSDSAKTQIWWNKDCSGVAMFEDRDSGKQTYFKFGVDSNTLQLTSKDSISGLRLYSDDYEKNLYSIPAYK